MCNALMNNGGYRGHRSPLTHMMNSLGWQTTDATPPIIIQGLMTVWPPVTEVPPSSAASRNPRIISGMTRSRSCDTHTQTMSKRGWTARVYVHNMICRLYLLIHLLADAQQHQHVVTLCDAHGVEIAEDVSARYPALCQKRTFMLKPPIHPLFTRYTDVLSHLPTKKTYIYF